MGRGKDIHSTANLFYDPRRFRSLKPASTPGWLKDYSHWLVANLDGRHEDLLSSVGSCKPGTDFESIKRELTRQRLQDEILPLQAQWPQLVRKGLNAYLSFVLGSLEQEQTQEQSDNSRNKSEQAFGNSLLVVSLSDLVERLKAQAKDPDLEVTEAEATSAEAVLRTVHASAVGVFNQQSLAADCARAVQALTGSDIPFYLREAERLQTLLAGVAQA